MALNKVLLLDEVRLLKLIQENGFDEVANILKNRKIDGQKLLNLSEFQTISWRLLPTQQKTLYNFIQKLKENPSVIFKSETKPALNPKPFTETKVSLKNVNVPSNADQHKFKQKLNSTLEGNRSSKPEDSEISTFPKLLESENSKPITTAPLPPFPQNFNKPKPVKPIRVDSLSSKSKISLPNDTAENKPNPLKPVTNNITDSKFKAALPLPNDKTDCKAKPVKPIRNDSLNLKYKTDLSVSSDSTLQAKPIIPERMGTVSSSLLNINKFKNNNNRPQSPEEDYEDIDNLKYTLDGYLSPNEFDINSNEDNLDDIYEPPPSLNKQPEVNKRSRETQMGDFKEATKGKGEIRIPMTGRPHVPPPPKPITPDEESDEETYEPIPHEELANLNTQPKCTVEDLKHVTIVEEEQSKRPNNFLGTISKLFSSRITFNRAEESPKPYNYENHMIKSEIAHPKTPNFGPNRPLPRVPSSQSSSTTSSFLEIERNVNKNNIQEKRSPRTKRSAHIRQQADTEEDKFSSHFHGIQKRSFSKEKMPEPSMDRRSPRPKNRIQQQLGEDIEDKGKIVGSQRISLNSIENGDIETGELPEYENSLQTTVPKINSNSTQPIFAENLADKLSEALKARDKELKQKRGINNKSENSIFRRNVCCLKSPPINDAEDDRPFYGNVDGVNSTADDKQLQPSSSFLWRHFNNLKDSAQGDNNKDEDDDEEFDECDPFYGNIDETDVVHDIVEVHHDITFDNQEEEVDEEDEELYIDSIFNINNEKFYRNTDRKGAKQLLRDLEDGAFLFRPSPKYFLVLTIKYQNNFYNLGIERTETNKIRLNADTSSVSPEFGTLRAFVNYFSKEALSFNYNDEFLEIYLNPVLPSDPTV